MAKMHINIFMPINDTPFEQHVFRPSDTGCHIKPTLSESVSLSLTTRLMTFLVMTLTNIPQETSNVPRIITFKNGISLREKVYNKQIMNTITSSDALYHVLWIFPNLKHHTQGSMSLVIL